MSNITNYLGLRPVLTAALAPFGVIGDVKFVCNAVHCTTGFGQYDAPYSKLEHALADGGLKASAGDGIVVLPGHVEDVVDETMLDNLKAGVPIIGIGIGVLRPRFNWTTTASQWRINVAGAVFANLALRMGEVANVVKSIAVTAPSCRFTANGMALTNLTAGGFCQIGIELGNGALDTIFGFNSIKGAVSLPVTDGILVNGSPIVPAGLEMHANNLQFSAGVDTGLVRIVAPAFDCLITNNVFVNSGVDTNATFVLEDVASQGSFVDNRSIVTRTAGNANGKGIVFNGATPAWFCAGDTTCDTNQANAVLSPSASS